MRIVVVLVLASMTVAGCGTDPADVVLIEKSQVEEAVTPGQAAKEAFSALEELGYSCVASDQNAGASPEESVCTMISDPGRVNCAVAMRVRVKYSGGRVDQVSVDGGDRCV